MIDFKPLDLNNKAAYDHFLFPTGHKGCEYNFASLFLWGRQQAAFLGDNLVFFSQFNRKSVYLFPVCHENFQATMDAIMEDAAQRGIPCCLTNLSHSDCAMLEGHYPGKFRFQHDRDAFDYIYDIEELSQLKGRKFQKKRNHLNKFKLLHSGYAVEPITEDNILQVQQLLDDWYASREDQESFCMERVAIQKALQYRDALEMEGIVLTYKGQILAMTLASPLTADTYDVHFEKAIDESAYVAINYEFARYLKEKHPQVQWLNREDDLGLEGLRRAKLSYNPHHLIEKHWAMLLEDGYDY